jgi:hypothetical protein
MHENQLFDDVEFVKQMIANNRRALVDNGIKYLATGVYIVVGVAATFLLDFLGKSGWMPYVWLALMTLLMLFIVVAQKRLDKGRVKNTFATQTFTAVWTACAVPILITSFLFFVTNAIPLNGLMASVSACMGIAYYLTGVINDLRFMKFLAAGWWAGVALSLLWSRFGEEYQLGLFFSVLILLLEIVPGIVIYKKWTLAAND